MIGMYMAVQFALLSSVGGIAAALRCMLRGTAHRLRAHRWSDAQLAVLNAYRSFALFQMTNRADSGRFRWIKFIDTTGAIITATECPFWLYPSRAPPNMVRVSRSRCRSSAIRYGRWQRRGYKLHVKSSTTARTTKARPHMPNRADYAQIFAQLEVETDMAARSTHTFSMSSRQHASSSADSAASSTGSSPW